MTPLPYPRIARAAVQVAAVRLAAMAMVLGLAACGIPNDQDFRPVDRGVIPSGLFDPTTTSTTSTTTSTSLPVSTTTPLPTTTTTTTTMPTEIVTLYFLLGDLLVPVERALPRGVTLEDVVGILSVGPIIEEDLSLRSALQFAITGAVTEQAGVAAVALEPSFADLSASEQRLAFAQLVYTLTSRPGIGQVSFTVDGRVVAVPRPDGSLEAKPGSKEDFASLLLSPTTTTPPGNDSALESAGARGDRGRIVGTARAAVGTETTTQAVASAG